MRNLYYRWISLLKHILLFIVLLVFFSACVKAIGVRNPGYTKKLKNIAILEFSGPDYLKEQTTKAFIQAIKNLGVVGIYLPHQVSEFLQGQGLNDSEPTDPAARKILSEKLRIDALMNGQVIHYDNTYRTDGNIELIVRLTDIETEEQIYSASVRSDGGGILSGDISEVIATAIESIIADIESQFDL